MNTWWDFITKNSGTVANLATILSLFGLILVFKQLRQSAQVGLGTNTIELVKYLQQENIRSARYYCLENLKGKISSEYTKLDVENASKVCSSYDLAGIFLKNNYAAYDVIVDSWGPSIIENHDILSNYISERRVISGPRFWDDFDWLAKEAESFGKS